MSKVIKKENEFLEYVKTLFTMILNKYRVTNHAWLCYRGAWSQEACGVLCGTIWLLPWSVKIWQTARGNKMLDMPRYQTLKWRRKLGRVSSRRCTEPGVAGTGALWHWRKSRYVKFLFLCTTCVEASRGLSVWGMTKPFYMTVFPCLKFNLGQVKWILQVKKFPPIHIPYSRHVWWRVFHFCDIDQHYSWIETITVPVDS